MINTCYFTLNACAKKQQQQQQQTTPGIVNRPGLSGVNWLGRPPCKATLYHMFAILLRQKNKMVATFIGTIQNKNDG